MPIRIDVDPRANLITLSGSGQLTFHDFKTAFEDRLAHPQYKPGMDILYDLRAASVDITLEELKEAIALFSARRAERGTHFRFAIVASTVGTYGITSLYQAHADKLPEKVRIFDDPDEARQWLNAAD